jgi:hypothetical protein
VDVIAGSCGQPLLHVRMFVRSVVIEHQMDVEARIDRLLDSTQKSQQLLMPMPGLALADDCSPGRNGRIGWVRPSA